MSQREAFVEKLVKHADAGRLHSQDATLQPAGTTRVKDPNALLSLPEFIREPIPRDIAEQELNNPDTMLTLPEFVREPIPQAITPSKSATPASRSLRRLQKMSRSRSLSAPPLAWLRSSPAKSERTTPVPPVPKTGKHMILEREQSLTRLQVQQG